MRTEPLGELGDAPTVLRSVAAAARGRRLPPPAALIGEWFDSRAIIAPSVRVRPVGVHEVFGVLTDASGSGAVGGGWFGYLSYPDPGGDQAAPRIPPAAGGWSDRVLRQDRDGQWWHESLSDTALPNWIDQALRSPVAPGHWNITWAEADRDAHRRGVADCLHAIVEGEVYQACVCTQFVGQLEGAAVDFFADTVARTSPARAAFVAGAWGTVASLSPELFLRRRGHIVLDTAIFDQLSSSPIKGTLPGDADPSELRASAKDIAENVMIVDLVRNDLSRVAITGSVTVPELLAVRPAPGVWHLVSTVDARVKADLPMSDVLDAMFPPASVTGTPKARARRLLSRWEPHTRGIYCGTIGLASPVAGCELNVAIRTVEFDADGSAILGVGGGITADSDADREWDECLHKAASILGAARPGRYQRRARRTAS